MLMDESAYWRDRAEWAEYEEWLTAGDDEACPSTPIFNAAEVLRLTMTLKARRAPRGSGRRR